VGRIILALVTCINLAAVGVTILEPIGVTELWLNMLSVGLLVLKEEFLD
jgi:hypothetical protein